MGEKEFEYTIEYLMNEPENTKYVEKFNSAQDLVTHWYNTHYNGSHLKVIDKRIKKLNNIYDNGKAPIKGYGLEMAFGFGESIYVLLNWYKDIKLDALDFNPLFSKIIPHLKDLSGSRLLDIWIGDAQKTGKPDSYYDFINSCSFFEHLPEDVYWNVVRECYRILKHGGTFGVYLDEGANYGEHIRCVPVAQTKKELESIGFISVSNYLYQKPI